MPNHECTSEVSRVMRLYVRLGVFNVGSHLARQLAALGDARSSGASAGTGAVAATDRPLQLWRSTVATKLGRLRRSCGLCWPRRVGCEHHDVLLERAEVVERRDVATSTADAARAMLSSARWVATNTNKARLVVASVLDEASAWSSIEERARKSIDASAVYREAVGLFVLACDRNLDYCLRRNVHG